MPDDFNYLMHDYGINLTDSNVIDLAKAFIIVSRPWDYQEIKFINISFINESINGWPVFTLKIETYSRINGVTDVWKFSIREKPFRQFDYVMEKVTGVRVGDFIENYEAPIGGRTCYPHLIGRSLMKGEERITHPILSQVFPNVTFYKVITEPALPPRYGIVAVYRGKEYHMPKEFNHLMFDCNISLTDSNAVDYAKAFIILQIQHFLGFHFLMLLG